ncbi:HNH endonuclease signature motif containing protein [Galactobacter valiniphilus]|uniref:HNH endonuclease signature motif containing protein n=1 Tax=Galactobacter valiniphilus TaxID=2676122 RepID=UPI00373594B5
MAHQPFGRGSAPGVLALRRLVSAPPEEFAAALSPGEEREWASLLERFLADRERSQPSPAGIPAVDPAASAATAPPAGVVWHGDAPAGRTEAVDSLGAAAHGASTALAAARANSSSLTVSELREALTALGSLTRAVAGLQAAYARELLVRPPSTSAGPVHKQLGYPSVRVALEHVLGLGTASAHALVDIAESTAPRQGFSAGELPPRYPVLAGALDAGGISAEQARTITQGLPSDHRRLDPAALAAAEAALVGAATAGTHGTMPEAVAEALARAGAATGAGADGGSAAASGAETGPGADGSSTPEGPAVPGSPGTAKHGLVTPVASGRGSLDAHRLRPVALRDQAKLWAAFLDPDGLEPDERKQRQARYLHLTQQANGMWRLSGLAPAFEGAQFKTLLDAMTSPHAQRTAPGPAGAVGEPAGRADAAGGATPAPEGGSSVDPSAGLPEGSGAGSSVAAGLRTNKAAGDAGVATQSDNDGRTAAQRRFDALAAMIARYAAGPDAPSVGGAAPTLLVLTTLGAFAAAAGEEPAPTAESAPELPTSGRHPGGTAPKRRSHHARPGSRRESPTTAPGTPVFGGSGGCWSPPRPDRPGEAPGEPRADRPPTGWTAPEHTGLGPDPDDPFDPRNFAGVGWAAEWNRASDSWAGDNTPADQPDPFDPATFAGRGWDASPGDPATRGNADETSPENPPEPGRISASATPASPASPASHASHEAPSGPAPGDEPSGRSPADSPAPGRSWASGGPASHRAAAAPAPAGPFLTPDGQPLPADPLRAVMGVSAWMPHTQQVVSLARVAHLVCGGAVQFMASDEAGHPLRLGRAQRLFTAHQRKALIARDLHCRAPGCALPAAFCEAHHLDPWHLGGATDVGQAVLLCPFHHHLAHQEHGF